MEENRLHTNNVDVTWADAARNYAANIEKVSSVAAKQLLEMTVKLRDIDDKSRILDIGTGTGVVVDAIVERIPSADVLATDKSQAMLDVVKKKTSSLSCSHVATKIVDANDLTKQLGGKTFSQIFSTFVLQFMKDCASTVQQIHDALEPGGTASLSIWGFNSAQQIIWKQACQSIDPSYQLPQPCEDPNAPWEISGLAGLFERAGFMDIEAVSKRLPFRLDAESYCRYWFDGRSPASVAFTKTWHGDMDAVRGKVEQLIKDEWIDGQDLIMQVVLIVARKERKKALRV